MQASPIPLVLSQHDVHACLDYFVQCSSLSTTLVVCSTKEAFLATLLPSNHNNPGLSEGTTISTESATLEQQKTPSEYLLSPTIRLLSRTSSIQLAFCPTTQHLRAYLSGLTAPPPQQSLLATAGLLSGRGRNNCPVLGALNLFALHRSTSDFSAQGVSRTLAVAVEAASRAGTRLVLVEVGEGFESTPELGGRASAIWDERLPLLSSTLKGVGLDDEGWLGKTVTLRRLLSKWFVFEDGSENLQMP